MPALIPAREIGTDTVDALAELRILQPGLPPNSGDSLILEHEGEAVAFSVFRIGDEFLCREEREAHPRTITLRPDELTLWQLDRSVFYRILSQELGIEPDPQQLARGVWQIGRRSLPGRGRAKVLFLETGYRAGDLERVLLRESYRLVCALAHGTVPQIDDIPSKSLVPGALFENDGRFHSAIFEDATASTADATAPAFIDLDASPPAFVIAGRHLYLPASNGGPTKGARYLAYLFDRPGIEMTCWDLYCAIHPDLRENVGHQVWTDNALDEQAKGDLVQALVKVRSDLEDAENDPTSSESEIQTLRERLDELLKQSSKNLDHRGKSRPLAGSGRSKSRQNVRKALGVVIDTVSRQDEEVGSMLRVALGDGDPVTFRPPAEWHL